jgi:hypothetical protein
MAEINDPMERIPALPERVETSPSPVSNAATKTPWWQDRWYVALISATIAAAVPLTTAATGWFQLLLSREKQAQDYAVTLANNQNTINQTYLKLAIDKDTKPQDRQIVLRFLSSTLPPDSPMKKWADQELVIASNILAGEASTAATPATTRPEVASARSAIDQHLLASYPVKTICFIAENATAQIKQEVQDKLAQLPGSGATVTPSCTEAPQFDGNGSALQIQILDAEDSGKLIVSFHLRPQTVVERPTVKCQQTTTTLI